jgi:hypothetical protein
MIRLGLNDRQKQKEILSYVAAHDIKKVYVFYWRTPPNFKLPIKAEYREYGDIIMYKYFYRLLEEIDQQSLIVVNECMRTQKRSDLTYNCLHHYLNNTPHRLIFQYFPIIDRKEDFLILLDMADKGRFRGKGFDYVYLQTEDVKALPVKFKYSTIAVEAPASAVKAYQEKKEFLLANIGQKDPDTVPRELQLMAGSYKKPALEPDKLYAARNGRLKAENVLAYKDINKQDDYIILDFHYRRINFNDFLRTAGMKHVRYLCTQLPVDSYYSTEFAQWKARIDSFYAQASIYK